jgi:hypothetical protein
VNGVIRLGQDRTESLFRRLMIGGRCVMGTRRRYVSFRLTTAERRRASALRRGSHESGGLWASLVRAVAVRVLDDYDDGNPTGSGASAEREESVRLPPATVTQFAQFCAKFSLTVRPGAIVAALRFRLLGAAVRGDRVSEA